MNDTTNRMNKIITKALETSTASRSIHDKYYKNNRSYTYATKPTDSTCMAYVDLKYKGGKLAAQPRLVLVMSHSDDELTMGTHHELTHIRQAMIAEERGIQVVSPELTLDEKIAKTLVWEAHARIGQTEGPLLSFFGDLLQGNTTNIDYYKKHFSALRNSEGAETYINALLGTKTRAHSMVAGVDEAGYAFMNGFSQLSKDEKEAAIIRARKETVKGFLHKQALMNNDTMDTYIGETVVEHAQQKAGQNVLEEIYGMAAYMTGQSMTRKANEILPLNKILLTTHGDFGPCLSEQDWYEALNAKSCNELAMRSIVGSKHNAAYMKLKNSNPGNTGSKFNYNF